LDEAEQIISEGCHKPQTDVDVDGAPTAVGIARGSALGHMIHHLVHGEQEAKDLMPLGEIRAGGVDLKFDVVLDVDVEDGVGEGGGWVGYGEGRDCAGERDLGIGVEGVDGG
jgi:hypothetical protein